MIGAINALGRRLRQMGTDGVTAIEFAFAGPFLILLLLGGTELVHVFYTRTMLRGEIDGAGRYSSLEAGINQYQNTDKLLKQRLQSVAPQAAITIKRSAYRNYAQGTSGAEPFVDLNKDGSCNNSETFTDINGNGKWDGNWLSDTSSQNTGGAREIVSYDITVEFKPLFGYSKGIFGKDAFIARGTTKLRNQPYSGMSTPKTGSCSS